MAVSRPPNVLLFITDQQRWDTLGYTGRTPCRTPNLDRLAQAGVAFDRCLSPDPICCPARAALFTGRAPHATGVQHNYQLPLERPALPEVFRDDGYHVSYHGKWHLGRGRGAAALEGWSGERGEGYKRWLAEHNFPDTYPYGSRDFAWRPPGTPGGFISTPRTAPQEGLTDWLHDTWVASETMAALETRPQDQPFFLTCSFIGPHPIFVIPEPYYSLYDPAQATEPASFADPMAGKPAFQTHTIWHQVAEAFSTRWEDWRKPSAVYWGFVTLLDELVGRVLGRLESLGLAEDTIVVFTSDHGEMMGSHGHFQKSSMYEEALRVPLIWRAPRHLAAGDGSPRRIDAPASLMDVAPTLLALCGLASPGSALLEPHGRDLSAWIAGTEQVPAEARGASDDPAAGAVFCEYTPYEGEGVAHIRCAAGPRYKYAWNQHDRHELYDTWADPAELHNRIDDAALSPVRDRLREALREWMRRTGDPLMDAV